MATPNANGPSTTDGLEDIFNHLDLSTALIHADHALVGPGAAPVAPDMSLTSGEFLLPNSLYA